MFSVNAIFVYNATTQAVTSRKVTSVPRVKTKSFPEYTSATGLPFCWRVLLGDIFDWLLGELNIYISWDTFAEVTVFFFTGHTTLFA